MHFLRLARPVNLIIIALTMYGIGLFFDYTNTNNSQTSNVTGFPFFLLVFSTILIAAAGNIINDYFDVKADRVNKPNRVIIGKFVKRRVAIITHWTLNTIAFSMAIYLSFIFKTFWYLFIHLLSINILWYYSLKAKRQVLIGNILVALLTALIPLLTGIYFYQNNISLEYFQLPLEKKTSELQLNYTLTFSIGMSVFAFLLNLAREIIKDIEDIEGDKKLPAITFPIKHGIQKSKRLALFILLITTFMCFFIIWIEPEKIIWWFPVLITSFSIISATITLFKTQSGKLRITHLWLKAAMIFGLFTPLYWVILLEYVVR